MNVLKSKPMKNIITIIAIFSLSLANASTDPAGSLVVFSSEIVEIKITDKTHADFFSISQFNFEENNLQFETENEISFIQIFDADDKLTFQLPVMSNKLKIGRSVFGSGDFKIGFMIKGNTEIQFADVNFKI